MIDLKFNKDMDISEYLIDIKVPSITDDTISMTLDTGSPISIICIQNLVKISNEPYSILLKRIDNMVSKGNTIDFGVYGSVDNTNNRVFVPYILDEVTIGGQSLKYFLFWVDVTHYKDKELSTIITSTLFGFDNIQQGYKYFDNNDDFHIRVDNWFYPDIHDINTALTNHKKGIYNSKEIHQLLSQENS